MCTWKGTKNPITVPKLLQCRILKATKSDVNGLEAKAKVQTTVKGVLIKQFVPLTFCLCFAFTGINFRSMLHHVCDMAYDENMCGPIKTRECRSSNWLINYMQS